MKMMPLLSKFRNPVSLLLLFLSLGMAYFIWFTATTIRRNDQTFRLVNHTHQVIEKLGHVNTQVFDFESQVRGYVISRNASFLSRYDALQHELETSLRDIQRLTRDNLVQQRHLQQLAPLIAGKIRFQEEVLRSSRQSNGQALKLISGLQGKLISDSLVRILRVMQQEERRLLYLRIHANQEVSQQRFNASLVIAVLAFVLLTVALLRLQREHTLRKTTEEKYRNLIENSSLMLFTTDLQGAFTYVGGKFRELTGYSREELMGNRYQMFLDPEWAAVLKAFYEVQVAQNQSESLIEFPIRTREGATRWVEQNVILLRHREDITGFQSLVKDITERKEAARLLAETEGKVRARQEENQRLLQSILDHIPMAVYMKDLSGKLLMANQQFYAIFGNGREQDFEKVERAMHPDAAVAERYAAADRQVTQTGQARELEGVFQTQSGPRDMLFVKFPLLDPDNRMFALCNVGRDITETVRFQRQLIDAKSRAEKAELLQEEFLANMSHEIRTPMNGIIGMTNLMETTPLNEEQQEYIELIKKSSTILLHLINNILDLSKIKAGKMTVELAHFHLQETVNRVVAPLEYQAREKGVPIVTEMEEAPVYLEGDQNKLVQVLNNLLSNAVKFTPKGQVTLRVRALEPQGFQQVVQFAVSDTGIGIAPENLSLIFQSFTQVSDPMVKTAGGTGLGLAITQKLIEIQGGHLSVASVPGEGTTFTVALPYRPSRPENLVEAPLHSELRTRVREFARGKKVLLVEDNLVNQKVSSRLLEKAGLQVDLAQDGKQAIDLLAAGYRYDLILMDLRMPRMDGFQTTTYIRNKLLLQTPIMAMTASVLRNEKKRCLEAGMNDYITKPFSPDALFAKMADLLQPGTTEAAAAEDTHQLTTNGLYNLAFIEELEDDAYTAEVLETFLETTPLAFEEIKDALLRSAWEELYQKAHKLKSSLGVLQMNNILKFISQIEDGARKQENPEAIENSFAAAVHQFSLIRPMLEADLAEIRQRNH
ncbi:PAS domain S-box protein [Paraflavisolibacter sp. H34]|uniref:PAS domain S-box protein n=1 Tax=Huijunlia imazamoxiresistens TaxID=3127457 RepID=UPI00301986B9